MKEIKDALNQAIDMIFFRCMEVGKEPLKLFKGSFHVRIAPKLYREVFLEVVRKNMNLNQFVQTT